MTVQYEADILRAIACGINAHDLQRMDPWTGAEVAEVMKRHNLAVTQGGTIVPSDTPTHKLLDLARYSPSPNVQKQAQRAHAQLLKLAEVLGSARAGERADDLRRHQRNALQSWLQWLRQAETEANGEIRRLAQSSPRSRAQKKDGVA
jgi:hypothetical protein